MTVAHSQLVPTQPRVLARSTAAIALAAAVLGGVLGAGVQAVSQGALTDRSTAASVRDLNVLKAAQEWEARYRQQYPNSR